MKYSTAIISAILCAEAALAGSLTGQQLRRRNREARRQARAEGKLLNTCLKIASSTESGIENASFSENWAGGVITSTDVTSVTATATVPTVASNDGAAWVGIDGDSCQTAILQTGFQWVDGEYSAWYEWYPLDSVNFDITISAGDSVKMTVTATSKSAGSATIDNLSTGESVSHSFSGESNELCEFDAEWIVEDFEECEGSDCSLVPFGDFGTLTFADATATIGGSAVDAGDSSIIDIEQNSKVLTDCSASGTTVTCTYE